MLRLRHSERERAIGMLAAKLTLFQVANHINVSRMTIEIRLRLVLEILVRHIDVPEVADHVKRSYVKICTSALFISGIDLDKLMKETKIGYMPKQFVTNYI